MPNRPIPDDATDGPPDLAAKQGLHGHDGGAFNVETPAHLLDSPLTPAERMFVRNNGLWPEGLPDDPDDLVLTLDGHVEQPFALSLRALKARFETVEVTAVLECAGNGRGLLDPPVEGLPWAGGAVACARFGGFRLADLLRAAGPRPEAVYTAHHSPDQTETGAAALSRGLPLWKAASGETLVAHAMNGVPLPRTHGGPLRIVAPGFPGSAWQKWLTRIELRDREHDGAKMTGFDYRVPTTPVTPGDPLDDLDWAVIEDVPVKSLVTHPAAGARLAVGEAVEIRGFAWSGRVPVASVAVACDGTWREAAVEDGDGPWAWRRFRLTWTPSREGPATLIARARDAGGRPQPLGQAWNPRGYCNNGCQTLEVVVAASPR